ncbi:acyl-CoA thioesterase [Streptomyces sp. SID3343]|uniref:acyl-CoA thioesterase n=1 Tax=Streptomyces sp. SID3343 TaxID=2690260 RepID=UPI00136CA478|nr:acyl-CoA thioesterase [Streptomyces sp. SID3343]MYV99734.1 thioesterase [Streptomyces sp. SID3343]
MTEQSKESAPQPFTVRVSVRGYETDSQGHLNSSVYMQYAEHARWALLEAGGIPQRLLLDNGVGPVTLETTVRYRQELHAGDEVDVDCVFVWGPRKTFRIEQSIRRPDGTVAAEVSSLAGLMNLDERRLVANPSETFRSLATNPPAAFGL